MFISKKGGLIRSDEPGGFFYFNRIVRGHRSIILGLGPLWITYYHHLNPRLMVWWSKRNLIGEP
jgi:hypothetical protein